MIHLVLLVSVSAFASPRLSPGSSYPVKKERKDPGVSAKPLDSFYSEMQMDFESFDAADPKTPIMATHTDQLTRIRKLPKLDPKDPAYAKDGLNERVEMTFERLVNTSKVKVPGLAKPFELRSDLGALLAGKPLVLRGDEKGPKRVENLATIRADVLAKAHDTMTRTAAGTLLNESMLLKAGQGVAQDSSCLGKLGGKKPGEKWSFSREEQGVKLEFECHFEGWSEHAGKKLAVIRLRSGKQRTERKQPNGVPGVAETEGKGEIYFEPETQESLMRLENDITVEPAAEEIGRLKAKGQPVPRNRSVMRTWVHVYPL